MSSPSTVPGMDFVHDCRGYHRETGGQREEQGGGGRKESYSNGRRMKRKEVEFCMISTCFDNTWEK